MGKINSNWNKSFRILEIVLWVSGIALLLIFVGSLLTTSVLHGKDIKEIETSLNLSDKNAPTLKNPNLNNVSILPNQSGWSEKRKIAYQKSLEQNKKKPIALLNVPAIDLKVAVLNGTDDQTLNRGVGRVPGTAKPNKAGNMAVAGHRDGFFRGLKDIKIGDIIEVTTLSGLHEYKIDKISIVKPDNVSVIQPTEQNIITLITCYPFYFIGDAPERYIVRAPLVSVKPLPSDKVS